MKTRFERIIHFEAKAFTLTEVIFTMLLSTLVILSGLGAMDIINKVIKQSSSSSLAARELLTFKSQLDLEINSAKRIVQISADSFSLHYRNSGSSEYMIRDEYIIRKSSWYIDTIEIKCRLEKVETISANLIKSLEISSTIEDMNINMFFNKEYSKAELFSLNVE